MPQFDFFILPKLVVFYFSFVALVAFVLTFSIALDACVGAYIRLLLKADLIQEVFLIRKLINVNLLFISGDLLEQFILGGGLSLLYVFFVSTSLTAFVLISAPSLFDAMVDFATNIGKDINQTGFVDFSRTIITYSTIFISVTAGNLLGILPFSFTFTGSLGVPFLFSFIIFFVCAYTLVYRNGLNLFAGFLPAGTSVLIAPLIICIELVSNIAKFISLGVRLFANMFAGHLLLKVFYSICFQVLSSLSAFFFMADVIVIFFIIFITVLELLIAFLQAFVFFLLSALYVKEAENFAGGH